MLITTAIKLSTLMKFIFFIVLSVIIVKYVYKIKNSKIGGRKSINYLLKRNTKSFLKNRYDMNILHKRSEDAKVYNINSDDDVYDIIRGSFIPNNLSDDEIYKWIDTRIIENIELKDRLSKIYLKNVELFMLMRRYIMHQCLIPY